MGYKDPESMYHTDFSRENMKNRSVVFSPGLYSSTNGAATAILAGLIELNQKGHSKPEVYQAGEAEGFRQRVVNLVDVLFVFQQRGLGRVAVIQASSRHMILRVFDCVCSHQEVKEIGCDYVAGFLAGTMRASGKYGSVNVEEIACREYPGRTCLFRAVW